MIMYMDTKYVQQAIDEMNIPFSISRNLDIKTLQKVIKRAQQLKDAETHKSNTRRHYVAMAAEAERSL